MNLDICTNGKKLFENVRGEVTKYVNKNIKSGIRSLVIGMSGGIDSAIVAAITSIVIKDIDMGTKIIGRSLPINSRADEVDRAKLSGKAFCDNFVDMSLSGLYKTTMEYTDIEPQRLRYTDNTNSSLNDKIRAGNLKARLRMIILYDLARRSRGMVLSTDNYTEYLLGFWTLHGDVGDFGMIQALWKTEVYALSYYTMEYFAKRREYDKADALHQCIKAMPTDGLGTTNNDFEQIFPAYPKDKSPLEVYRMIDKVLVNYLKDGESYLNSTEFDKSKFGQIIERYKATEFKRENPYNLKRVDLIV